MLVQFDLPTQRADSAPVFANARACADWLESLPLTSSSTAQAQLRAQVALLSTSPLKPAVLAEVLEQLRESVLFVQSEMAKKFAYHPLPLSDLESQAWNGTLELWRVYSLCWRICVQAVVVGDLQGQGAQVCQRALDAHARLMFDHVNACAELPAAEWQMLHMLYRAAEHAGVAADRVRDKSLAETSATNCMATYARPILVALGSPNEWGARQTQMILRWTERWATKIVISHNPPAKPVKPPILVDLGAGEAGFRTDSAARLNVAGANLRYLDISGVARSLKNRIILLRKGETPASLGLGEDAVMPACELTLISLYQHWGDGRVGREQARRSVGGRVFVAGGVASIHYYVSGKPFKQPGHAKELTSQQRQEIATFGRLATRDEDEHSHLQGFTLEEWELGDESLAGLRLIRAVGAGRMRVAVGQLVGARPPDARAYILGTIRWVQLRANGQLMIGVKSLPGAPQAVATRATGVNAAQEKYQQALLLPSVPALKEVETLLIAPGTHKPGRVLELQTEIQRQLRLEAVLERGSDFERCTFTYL